MTRVLFPFVGDTIGGSHHSAALLMAALPAHGVEPMVLVHRAGPLNGFLGTTPADLPVWQAEGGPLASLWRLLRITPALFLRLRRARVDAVHVNDGRMAVSWSLACRLAGVPLVVHQRTRFAPSRVSALALALARRVVAISDYTRASLPPSVQDRVTVIANPFRATEIDRAIARQAVAAELGFDPARPVLALVGTLQRQKRPLVALAALARLRGAGHDAVLLVAGRAEGAEADAVRAFVRDNALDGAVRVLGFRNDVGRLLAAADILVAPAVNEGHGRALVEAMLAETAVVASRSGGHGEVIEDSRTGVLVPPDESGALADAVAALLDDPTRRSALAAAGRAAAMAEYGIDAHAEAMARLYAGLHARAGIALVIESMGGGGAQQVAARLLADWAGRGLAPCLITLRDANSDAVAVDPRVARRVIGGAGSSPTPLHAALANLRRLAALRRAVRDSGAGTVVAFVTATNVLTVLATLGLGVRVVVSERNDPGRQPVGRAWDLLRRLTYGLAWKVTANTRAALDSMATYVPRKHLALVPNPLRPAPDDTRAGADAPYVLAVGRLHAQKNYPMLIHAFAAAGPALAGWRLRVLGEGGKRAELEALARELGIADRVDMLGHVADPFPHYRAAGMFVMCSHYEGSPNALLEAMSCGCAAIVTDCLPGALEVVRHEASGVVVPAGDTAALAAALAHLAGDAAARRRLGEAAVGAVAPFAPPAVLARWREVLGLS